MRQRPERQPSIHLWSNILVAIIVLLLCFAAGPGAAGSPAPVRADDAHAETAAAPPAKAERPEIQLRILGGLAGVDQFNLHEKPFWSQRIRERSGGRIAAEVLAFDQSGIRGQDMLRLLKLGVVPFGTLLLSLTVDMPELGAADLPLLSPDFTSLRRATAAYRPVMKRLLADEHQLELLAIYTYPAQVLFCRRPFRGLSDLAGRRIRTSSVAQAELVEALGAIPVVTPFAEIVASIQRNVVDCAITGTLSGHAIGLHEVTSHIHAMAVSWGMSVFAANGQAWQALPPDARDFLRREIAALEEEIWAAAEEDTGRGLACNTGQAARCKTGRAGSMTLVPLLPEDATRQRQLIANTVLPGWLERCGAACAEAWDSTIGPLLSIPAARN